MDDWNRESQDAHDESSNWFECDDGWATLIAELEAQLKALSPDYTVSQVKEKFAGLRYHANPGDVDQETSVRFYDLIREAEVKSYETCECCGQPGRLARRRRRGWYKTLCPACSVKMNFEFVGSDE